MRSEVGLDPDPCTIQCAPSYPRTSRRRGSSGMIDPRQELRAQLVRGRQRRELDSGIGGSVRLFIHRAIIVAAAIRYGEEFLCTHRRGECTLLTGGRNPHPLLKYELGGAGGSVGTLLHLFHTSLLLQDTTKQGTRESSPPPSPPPCHNSGYRDRSYPPKPPGRSILRSTLRHCPRGRRLPLPLRQPTSSQIRARCSWSPWYLAHPYFPSG